MLLFSFDKSPPSHTHHTISSPRCRRRRKSSCTIAVCAGSGALLWENSSSDCYSCSNILVSYSTQLLLDLSQHSMLSHSDFIVLVFLSFTLKLLSYIIFYLTSKEKETTSLSGPYFLSLISLKVCLCLKVVL